MGPPVPTRLLMMDGKMSGRRGVLDDELNGIRNEPDWQGRRGACDHPDEGRSWAARSHSLPGLSIAREPQGRPIPGVDMPCDGRAAEED